MKLDKRELLRSGFTLIELLVVVGIIAILSAILIPSLASARRQAQATKCLTNIRQWGIATLVYVGENSGILPVPGDPRFGKYKSGKPSYGAEADGDSEDKPLGFWQDSSLWINALPPLVNSKTYDELQLEHMNGGARLPRNGSNSLFVCPTYEIDIDSGDVNDVFSSDSKMKGYFQLWGYPDNSVVIATDQNGIAASPPTVPEGGGRPAYFAYAWNSKFTQSMPRVKVSMLSQNHSESSIVLIEEKRVHPTEVPQDANAIYQAAVGYGPSGSILRGKSLCRIKGDWQRFAGRHNGGGNLLFADGHASFFKYKELVKPSAGYGDASTADFNLPGKVIWNPFGPAREN